MIEVSKLTKKFNDKTVLNHMNATIKQGCIYGIVGTNGIGKTTLLKLIGGFIEPTSGEIIIDGQKQTKENYFSHLGFVPDNTPLYEYLTGTEYLLFTAAMFDVPKNQREQKVTQLINMFNLTPAKDNLISTYSNGMKQKISIASAIINDPDVLLLDEPLTGIDLISSQIIREYLKEFSKEKTVVLTTHLLELAHSLCDTIAILHDGKITEEFSTEDFSLRGIEDRIKKVYLNKNIEDMVAR